MRKFELQPLSPKFSALIPENAKLETVATGFGFTEGPVWDPRGFLSSVTRNRIKFSAFTSAMDGRKNSSRLETPTATLTTTSGGLFDCASVLRAIIAISKDGKYKILADHFEGKKFNSPNDVVIGPDGALYFTDPTLDLPKGEKQEIPFQGVYRLDTNGKVQFADQRPVVSPTGWRSLRMVRSFMWMTASREISAFTISHRMVR